MRAPKHMLLSEPPQTVTSQSSSPLRTALLSSVRFFQKWISPIDGPRCNFSPTCSQFGYEAVHDHGVLLGTTITADRLMRCGYWTEAGKEYVQLENGTLYDPVSDNLLDNHD